MSDEESLRKYVTESIRAELTQFVGTRTVSKELIAEKIKQTMARILAERPELQIDPSVKKEDVDAEP